MVEKILDGRACYVGLLKIFLFILRFLCAFENLKESIMNLTNYLFYAMGASAQYPLSYILYSITSGSG
jgi:hypothetical protein